MKKLFYIAGLPRAGSTLLANLLAQNKNYHSTETSGIIDVLFATRNQWSNLVEHKAHPCPERLLNVLKGILNGYFADINKPVIFVKSRAVLAYIELIESIVGYKIKVLVPVRPVKDILTSFEVLYRETSTVKQVPGEAENYFQFQTVQGRIDYWMRPEQVVGISLSRLKDAISRGLQDRLFFIDFNQLTSEPEKTFKGIYEFLNEPYFKHNFDNVEQVTQENDDVHGFINLHKIRSKVMPVKSRADEILGKDIKINQN